MKQHIKIVKKSKSQYSISIPMKIIKKFDWDDDTYLEISKIKNGIFLSAAGTSDKSTSKYDWINDNGPPI